MGKKNRRRKQVQKPAKPERVIVTRGILTFDSLLSCGHRWQYLDREDVRCKDFERECKRCGAGSTLNERRKVVAYDWDWDHGKSKVREDLTPEEDAEGPVTWESKMNIQ
jgi:hypothetical protein